MSDASETLGKIGFDTLGTSIREPIFVSLASYKKSKYLDIRKYYQKDGQWLPTQKGITIHSGQFQELLLLLTSHQEKIEEWLK